MMNYKQLRKWAQDGACCNSLRHALYDGTDNEGYGSLVSLFLFPSEPLEWHMGMSLPPVKFCPWCATLLPLDVEER